MKRLLDTHALLWLLTDDAQLSARASQVIKNPRNAVWGEPSIRPHFPFPFYDFRLTISDSTMTRSLVLDTMLTVENYTVFRGNKTAA